MASKKFCSCRFRTRLSIATAAKIRKPVAQAFQNGDTPTTVKPLDKIPIKMQPRAVPSAVPEPPKILVPPITTAEMTSNSSPRPTSAGLIVAYRAV